MEALSSFVMSLVACIIFLTIIEIILPDNKNKKYVSFVCGIVLIIVVINPVTNLLNKDFDISKLLLQNEYNLTKYEYKLQSEKTLDEEVENMYIKSLEKDISKRIEKNGYLVQKLNLEINKETYEIESLKLEVKENSINIVPVKIGSNIEVEDKMSENEKQKIKDILKDAYEVNNDVIEIVC